MKYTLTGILLAVAVLVAAPATAQDQPEMTPEQMAEMQAYMQAGTPGAPHEAMASTVGTYDLAIKSWHEPGAPAVEDAGTAVREMGLGGRVMFERVESSMMGMPYTGQSMTGYDNVTGKYWSVWMDSMSTGMMASEGTCDAQHTCTYVGSWHDPITKGPKTVRMITRRTGPATEVFEMHGPGRDGNEMKMMEIVYTKK